MNAITWFTKHEIDYLGEKTKDKRFMIKNIRVTTGGLVKVVSWNFELETVPFHYANIRAFVAALDANNPIDVRVLK